MEKRKEKLSGHFTFDAARMVTTTTICDSGLKQNVSAQICADSVLNEKKEQLALVAGVKSSRRSLCATLFPIRKATRARE